MRVNVIDTPGYPEFVGQVISAVCAAETAIVTINGTAGVEANTRRTFELAGRAQLARIIVLNKLDVSNIDFLQLVQRIQDTFGKNCIPINVPCGIGPELKGVVSTLNLTHASPNGAVVDPAAYGAALMETIVEADQALFERYLDGQEVKVHQMLDAQGGQVETVDEAHAGDVVVVAKIDDFQVGDTLVSGDQNVVLPSIAFPTPMIGLAVEPKSRADQQKISGALHKIEEEDPTFRIIRDPQTHELVMRGMSDLHLQIVQERLRKRDKVDIVTHVPKVPYREACSGHAEGSYRHKKQSGGSGQFAEVHLRVYALPHDIDPETYFTRANFECLREYRYDKNLNFAFLDCVSGGTVPNQFIPAVEAGVREQMEKGVIAGCQVQDIAVSLFYGKDHPVDSNEAAFRTAGSHCFRDVFQQAKPCLLEPMMHLDVSVPDPYVGTITSDLNTRRGRLEGMDTQAGGVTIVHARAPLSELTTYARTLSGMTGGQGSFSLEFSHYEQVPTNEQQKTIASVHLQHNNA